MPNNKKFSTFLFITTFLLLSFLTPFPLHAETLHLNSGKKITGDIVNETDDYIKIQTSHGLIATYYKDEIKSVEGNAKAEVSSLPEPEKILDISKEEYQSLDNSIPIEEDADDKYLTDEAPSGSFQKNIQERAEKLYEPVQEKFKALTNLDPLGDDSKEKFKESIDKQKANISSLLGNINRKIPSIDETISGSKETAEAYLKKSKTFKKDFAKKYKENSEAALAPFIIGYILFSFPLMRIAQRLNVKKAWLAWIPIFNLFLVIPMTSKPLWKALILLIPVIGFIYWIMLWMEICDLFQKPKGLGILSVVPGVNILLITYLAVSR